MTIQLARAPVALSLALGLGVAGCADQAPQPMPPPAAAISYDGTYTGTIRVTGAATSMQESDCATDPRFAVVVAGNQFSFPLPHPAASRNTPSLRQVATPVYNASIGPDGTIKGLSNDTNTPMSGRVTGTRMTGQVDGLLCNYAFTADRG
ncbi:hypothetical protein [Dankookia sp. P2]|uniref:hypothetical protein n=1 Tax=Dankookia sp. P2 TaxID=3423955 RepID=UPI003D66B0BF